MGAGHKLKKVFQVMISRYFRRPHLGLTMCFIQELVMPIYIGLKKHTHTNTPLLDELEFGEVENEHKATGKSCPSKFPWRRPMTGTFFLSSLKSAFVASLLWRVSNRED